MHKWCPGGAALNRAELRPLVVPDPVDYEMVTGILRCVLGVLVVRLLLSLSQRVG